MTLFDDDTFIPDDDLSGEWLAQVFEAVAEKCISHDGYRERLGAARQKLRTPNLF